MLELVKNILPYIVLLICRICRMVIGFNFQIQNLPVHYFFFISILYLYLPSSSQPLLEDCVFFSFFAQFEHQDLRFIFSPFSSIIYISLCLSATSKLPYNFFYFQNSTPAGSANGSNSFLRGLSFQDIGALT